MPGPSQETNDEGEVPMAAPGFMARLDAYGACHPRQMYAATLLAAVLAAVTLLSQTQGAVVLYQAF